MSTRPSSSWSTPAARSTAARSPTRTRLSTSSSPADPASAGGSQGPGVQHSGRVLDAGCGSGVYLAELAACGAEAIGFDQSADMVRHARARLRPSTQVCRHNLDGSTGCPTLHPTAWHEEIGSCSWCHTATHVGGEWFEIARPPYLPMEMRWLGRHSV
ncbi:class I SAM-dependent methyltransferase [Streptomyces sp. NPDC001312]|uniref:class I SAM-dependent methyltransferase n=1 Tax=Streptomyces sp. NPDC001312 TaxID=3364561 RepID=UPI00367984BF